MKRRILALALVLCLLFALCGCFLRVKDSGETHAAVSDDTEDKPDRETDDAAPVSDAPIPGAEYLPDFSVDTVDGGTFTLSEALADHELVLINLFATWCGPCRMEFPHLQEAWEQEQDRVAVIALSVEPNDTLDALRDFADELDLTFPMGREEGTELSRFVTEGIPTTILVDRTGKVAAVEVGAMPSAYAFRKVFDAYAGAGYDPADSIYIVCAYNYASDSYTEGMVVNFCTDTKCTPVTTGPDGFAVFTGPPENYHVELVSVPDGLYAYADSEWVTEKYGQIDIVYLLEDGT